MKYQIGYSEHPQAEACVNEATRGFGNPKLILYFSQVDQFAAHTALLHQKFPNSICMGASTHVGIRKEGAFKRGMTAVGIESGIRCSAGVLPNAKEFPIKGLDGIRQNLRAIGSRENTLCLEFTTALCCAEETVLAVLNAALEGTQIPIMGGSAGDDASGKITYVGLNGETYDNGCVYALLHNEGGAIHLYRENIYKPITGNVLTATKVDWVNRIVKEYDHEPAARVYARELGVPESEVTRYFDTNPMGRLLGKTMFITANNLLMPDKSIAYHARVYANYRVVVLEPDDYRSVVQRTMAQIRQEVPNPSFAIMCHCFARTLLFEGDGYLQEYCRSMGTVLGNYIGFSGYGEQLNQEQFNQTMTVVVFE